MPAVARLLLFGLCFVTGGDCMPVGLGRSGEPDLLPRFDLRWFAVDKHGVMDKRGVVHASYQVLTWVPGEPRRAVPHDTIEAIIDLVEARYLHDLFAVQMVFLILVLYYSFSRTECPCPKTYAGRECFDKDTHWW